MKEKFLTTIKRYKDCIFFMSISVALAVYDFFMINNGVFRYIAMFIAGVSFGMWASSLRMQISSERKQKEFEEYVKKMTKEHEERIEQTLKEMEGFKHVEDN